MSINKEEGRVPRPRIKQVDRGVTAGINRPTGEETVDSWYPAHAALVYAGGTPWK
jgi:hypothetical protein